MCRFHTLFMYILPYVANIANDFLMVSMFHLTDVYITHGRVARILGMVCLYLVYVSVDFVSFNFS